MIEASTKQLCTWTQGSENYEGEWDTSCGDVFEFNDGTPEENSFKFCPFCGRHIVQKLYEPEEDNE